MDETERQTLIGKAEKYLTIEADAVNDVYADVEPELREMYIEFARDQTFFEACRCFGEAKEYGRLWSLYKERVDRPMNQVDALTYLIADPNDEEEKAAKRILEIAHECRDSHPQVALDAIPRLMGTNAENDLSIPSLILHIAEKGRASNDIRQELRALLMNDIFLRVTEGRKRVRGLIDALKMDIKKEEDKYLLEYALGSLGEETEAEEFREQFDDSPTMGEVYLRIELPDQES